MAQQDTTSIPAVADRQTSWIDQLPGRLRPFAVLARWDRPIGTWLLLLPCWWSTALAPGLPDLWLLVLFAVGAFAMRGAGCTINDMLDRDLDARVERTRHRPLASGRLRTRDALLFLGLQLGVGLAVVTQLNGVAMAIAFASMPFVIIYPLMKRVTWWPQAMLGITFNWGALVGWAAVMEGLDPAPLFLYAAGFFWTLGYDTIYAHQDKDDDALIGVRSSARRLGDATVPWLFGFYGAALVLLLMAGFAAGLNLLYFPALLPTAGHFLWQVRTLRIDEPDNCLQRFRSNRDAGLLVFGAILLGQVPLP